MDKTKTPEQMWIDKQKQRAKTTRNITELFMIGYFIIWAGILFIPEMSVRLICGGLWIAFFAFLIIIGEIGRRPKKGEMRL